MGIPLIEKRNTEGKEEGLVVMQILLYYGTVVELKLENDGFCGGRKNLRTQRNSLGARRELMANSTHNMATGRNRTRAALVEGERFHHYANPVA